MKAPLLVAALLLTAAAPVLTCPPTAPAGLPKPGTRLQGVEVLSYAAGEKIDPASPPTLVPDRAGYWDFSGYDTAEVQELWCQYAGNPRDALRLGPKHLHHCTMTETSAWCD